VIDDNSSPSVREAAERSDVPLAEGEAAHLAHPDEVGHLTDKVDTAPARRCVATSKSGRSCTNLAAYADQRCLFHSFDPTAVAAKTAGRSKGGAMPRRTTVAGLGLPDPEVAGITVGDSAGQLAVLDAVVRSLATGKVSAHTATAIIQAVRAANQILATDQSAAIAELERRIAALVVEAPRGRR
jgi:hypothetical protein